MSMTKQLWSVNALANELGYDRRTVAKRLTGVRPDGQLQNNPAWFLDTAMSVLNVKEPKRKPRGDLLLEITASRLEDWREIYATDHGSEDPGRVTIADIASSARVDPTDVLTWLRVGCPYVEAGNWETGEGFVLRFTWATEWAHLMLTRLLSSGEDQLRRDLGLHKGAFA